MEFSEVLKARRSTRQFTDEGVTAEQIMKLIDAAIAAPNACNMQSWHFYVVTDENVKRKLSETKTVADWATTAPVIFVVCTAAKALTARFGDIGENLFAVQDTAAAIENILLAAADMGLGGCFMGAFDKDKCREIVGVAEDHRLVAMVPVGHPAMVLPARPRNPIESAVTFVGDVDKAEYRDTETQYRKYEVKNSCLKESVFDNLNLSKSTFHNINMSGTSFSDINMKNCKYGGLTLAETEFGCVDMKKCEFNNVELCCSNFENVTFGGSDMKNVDMTTVDFERIDFSGANFDDVNFSGANFDDVDFSGVDFGAADMSGANFDGADMSGASFCDVDLSGADFSGAAFDGGCEFNGATVDGIDIAEAIRFYKENQGKQ